MTTVPLLRRYAAWSLDAALLGLFVVALLHRPLGAGLRAASDALDALARVMAEGMAVGAQATTPPLTLLQDWLSDPALHAAAGALARALGGLTWQATLAFALLSLPYFAVFEASRWQATPGKRWLGLRVVDDDGQRLHLARAALRQAAGALSWLGLNVGHAMAALAPRHQALHDRIAGAHVLREDAAPLPGAAQWWLALQLPACVLLLALLLRHVDGVVAAALEATGAL